MLYANPSGARLSLDVTRGGKVPLPIRGVSCINAKPYFSGRFPLPLTKKADTRGRVDKGDFWCVKSYIAMMPLS